MTCTPEKGARAFRIWTWNVAPRERGCARARHTPQPAERLKSTAATAMRYAAGVNLMGATGFDVGCEPSGAYRGCSLPRKYLLQIIVANDDNYALAA
jgi:hypothetical protein